MIWSYSYNPRSGNEVVPFEENFTVVWQLQLHIAELEVRDYNTVMCITRKLRKWQGNKLALFNWHAYNVTLQYHNTESQQTTCAVYQVIFFQMQALKYM